MFRKPILLISILVAGVTLYGELCALEITPEDRGIVFVHVVHSYGSTLEGAEIKLTRKGGDGKPEDTEKFSSYTLKDIPYGRYVMQVTRPSFFSESREIVIDQPESWFTVGMRLGEIDAPNSIPLWKRVTPVYAGKGDTKWVRLASLYSDMILESKVERSSGEFSFTKVAYGSYILLTLSDTNLCDMRRVDLTAESIRWITINLTNGPCLEKKKEATLLSQK